MNYLAFFGLETEPFSNAPANRFYYDSAQHSQATVRLRFALSAMKGLALCVGEIGAGKTTLARRLLDSLDDDEYEAALLVILHRDITSEWLLRRVAFQLGVPAPSKDKLALLAQLHRRLMEIHEEGRKAVVLIDEAQMLESRGLMEEFRGLLNLEVPGKKLLSFVFFGLPSLESQLHLDPPLLQRVAVRVKLDPFDLPSTDAYIRHRLRVAGAQRHLFTREAVTRIHRCSGGVPRLINTLCDNALFESALAAESTVTAARVDAVAENLSLAPPRAEPAQAPSPRDHGPATAPNQAVGEGQADKVEVDEALDEIDRVLQSLGKLA
jgi:type II secretory pathway predicted ATPase ExeA